MLDIRLLTRRGPRRGEGRQEPQPLSVGMRQTLQGSFSAVSKRNFASKYSLEREIDAFGAGHSCNFASEDEIGQDHFKLCHYLILKSNLLPATRL